MTTVATTAGDGQTTEDGCPVEVYRRLPERGEAALVHAAAPPGGSILDLGAGVGRIAQAAEAILADIAVLDLGRPFDVVLLASHLVNTTDLAVRTALLRTAARHLAPTGSLVLQWHPPGWFDGLVPGSTTVGFLGEVRTALVVHRLAGGRLDATVTYDQATPRGVAGRRSWRQPFAAQRRSEADLGAALAACGLRRVRAIDAGGTWIEAVPCDPCR